MIKYIGSKRRLVPQIVELISSLGNANTVLDLFSGTARVGHALKRAGYCVTANDHNAYAHVLGRCYVEADRCKILSKVETVLDDLRRAPRRAAWFTDTYCVRSRYFQPKNGERIEGMREAIVTMGLDPIVEAVALTSLMEAADRVDSTVGLQMAYLKSWAARAHNELELRVPELLDGPGRATCLDAALAVRQGGYDVVYLDPPYNQHKYRNNYHVWESLVRWDAPEVYGRACKRVDCKSYDSPFNSKRRIGAAFAELVTSIDARFLVVSFNDEGYLSRDALEQLLGETGHVSVHTHESRRYVGAKIGIYNPGGEKVGKVGRLHNHEHLFVVDRSQKRNDRTHVGVHPAASA